jgi:PAS domain S-box-containing protein
MWGLPPGAFDRTGTEYFANLIHPDDRERVMNLNNQAIKTGQPTRAQWRIVWPDGSIHWIAAAWQAFMDESGQPARLIGMNSDITERKEAEDRLLEYERAVEGVEELVTVIDREFRCLMANRGFLKRRNLTKEQVVGHFAHEFIAKEPYERIIKAKLEECFQGNVVRYELKYTYPQIGERDLFISYYPIRGNKGVDRAACIVHDITDRKRSEEALRKSEERFRLAADAGRMYSFDWDLRTDKVVRSSEHTKVLGLTEPLHSSHSEFVEKIHPDDRERFAATIAGLTPENPTAVITYRVMDRDGALVWLRSSGRGIFDAEGRLQHVIGMVADISDLKRAEQALAEMTRKLIEAQEQERARIARELHDDIGQRLALVAVELDQVQGETAGLSPEVRRRIGDLQKQAQDVSADLHALSHDLHSSKLEYLGVVAGIRSWCEEFGQRHKIDVAFSSNVSTALPFELGLSLFRVVQQALHNAAKHSGVKRVEVQLRETADEIHMVITDSGRGFDVERALRGKGLGLSSMSERVRLVNGTISIESQPMRGTTIRVKVPIASERFPQRAAV